MQFYTLFVYKLEISPNIFPLIQEITFIVVCLRKSSYLLSHASNNFLNLFSLLLLGSSFPSSWPFAV